MQIWYIYKLPKGGKYVPNVICTGRKLYGRVRLGKIIPCRPWGGVLVLTPIMRIVLTPLKFISAK